MDINVFLFEIGFILIFVVIGMLGSKGEMMWAIPPAMGGIIGIYFTLSLLADGSITNGTTVLASASNAITSVWRSVELMLLSLSLLALMISIYRGYKSL